MRYLCLLSALCLVAACTEAPTDPGTQIEPNLAASAKVPFTATLTFVGTVEPGEVRVTPSGVLHGDGLINEFAMTGDLEGSWFFIGKYMINTANGKGRSIPMPALLVITSPLTGGFECNGSGKIEHFGTPDFIQYGNMTGCKGSGDYEGMKMKSYITNEATPGGGTYQLTGEIW